MGGAAELDMGRRSAMFFSVFHSRLCDNLYYAIKSCCRTLTKSLYCHLIRGWLIIINSRYYSALYLVRASQSSDYQTLKHKTGRRKNNKKYYINGNHNVEVYRAEKQKHKLDSEYLHAQEHIAWNQPWNVFFPVIYPPKTIH